MKKYAVILTYDVTVSKVIEVEAKNPTAARDAAIDIALSGDSEDHYTLQADDPDGWTVERIS